LLLLLLLHTLDLLLQSLQALLDTLPEKRAVLLVGLLLLLLLLLLLAMEVSCRKSTVQIFK
jgi:hypothetical protein